MGRKSGAKRKGEHDNQASPRSRSLKPKSAREPQSHRARGGVLFLSLPLPLSNLGDESLHGTVTGGIQGVLDTEPRAHAWHVAGSFQWWLPSRSRAADSHNAVSTERGKTVKIKFT